MLVVQSQEQQQNGSSLHELQQDCFALYYALKELLKISVDTLQEADWMIAKLIHKYYYGQVKLDTLYIRLMRFKFSIPNHNIQFRQAAMQAVNDISHLKALVVCSNENHNYEFLKKKNITPVNICMFCENENDDFCKSCFHLFKIFEDVNLLVVDEKTTHPAIKINAMLDEPVVIININSPDVDNLIALARDRKIEHIKNKFFLNRKVKKLS